MTPQEHEERQAINAVAAQHGVDALFLWAIRIAERGRPGCEFGVLSVSAPTFIPQTRRCAETLRDRLTECSFNPLGMMSTGSSPLRRLVYLPQFIGFFRRHWVPDDAETAADTLNQIYGNLVVASGPRDPTRA